jgi:hypothetical protein
MLEDMDAVRYLAHLPRGEALKLSARHGATSYAAQENGDREIIHVSLRRSVRRRLSGPFDGACTRMVRRSFSLVVSVGRTIISEEISRKAHRAGIAKSQPRNSRVSRRSVGLVKPKNRVQRQGLPHRLTTTKPLASKHLHRSLNLIRSRLVRR